ncbi:uncharacterized protein BDW43DRAFT_283535 [Aspergillus alliaceus]|uniref:uncharacterized protein n=1 Tax=Petromyces alliaceus TaxID=209559 RepID=UPI0012A61B14|nr:uncharacterized protein BDW43DRAFT_283535 [Aspergillus alliaceus]KAB8231085.1 hypothetical protein BDW43DRAFT_283535 [Aspergillus alliaceus]
MGWNCHAPPWRRTRQGVTVVCVFHCLCLHWLSLLTTDTSRSLYTIYVYGWI